MRAKVPEKMDGTDQTSSNCVTKVNHVNVGTLVQVIPGALIERIVVIRFTLPIVRDPHSMRRPKAISVSPPPGRNSLEFRGA